MDTAVASLDLGTHSIVVPANLKLASFLQRVSAFVIDWVIILGVIWGVFLTYHIITQRPLEVWEASFYQMLYVVLYILYNLFFIYRFGATLGKRLLNIKVVGEGNSKLTFLQVLGRETVGRALSTIFFQLGYIWMIFDKNGQTWHDGISKTIVIQEK